MQGSGVQSKQVARCESLRLADDALDAALVPHAVVHRDGGAGVQVVELRSLAERHLGDTPYKVRQGEASPTVAPRPPSPDFSGVHPDVAKDPKYADFAADLKNKVPADKMRWPDPLAPRIARDTS